MNQFLAEGVAGSEVHQDVVLGEILLNLSGNLATYGMISMSLHQLDELL